MVDSLPPSGIDPDNQTIITNSNDKLEVISTAYYLANFAQDSGDWTGFDSVSDGIAKVLVYDNDPLPRSASVTANLTGIDVLNFRIEVSDLKVKIKVDGIELVTLDSGDDFQALEISGLDHYGANSTLTLEAYYRYDENGAFYIDYVRSVSQPKSRKIELVDTGGLE